MENLYNTATDVTEIAGTKTASGGEGSGSVLGLTGVLEQATMMATSMAATLTGKRQQIQDAGFRARGRHVMSCVSSEGTLANFLHRFAKAERPVFDNLDSNLRRFLRTRHYHRSDIDDYLITDGLLPQLSRTSFRLFRDLLTTIQGTFTGPGQRDMPWNMCLGRSMFDQHSEELLRIRSYSTCKKDLILATYCYLRDANDQDFFT